jgi:hypothetical protein
VHEVKTEVGIVGVEHRSLRMRGVEDGGILVEVQKMAEDFLILVRRVQDVLVVA